MIGIIISPVVTSDTQRRSLAAAIRFGFRNPKRYVKGAHRQVPAMALSLFPMACFLRFDGSPQLEGIILHYEGHHLLFRSLPPRFFSIPEAIFETSEPHIFVTGG
jgi:hypothetical protein